MPEEIDDDLSETESSVIRELRAKAKRADEAEAQASTLRTENALLKAKLDLSPDQQTALLAVHKDGELTSEALLATAAKLGFTAGTETPKVDEPQVPAEEQAAHERVAETTAGQPGAEATVTTIEDRIRQAKSPEELDALLAGETGGRIFEQPSDSD